MEKCLIRSLTQLTTVNPSTGKEIAKYDAMDKEHVFHLVSKAKRAFPEWKKDYEKRRSYIYNLVEYLKKNKTELGKIATAEMGKALKESIGEVEKCAWALEFYADHGDSFLSDEVLNTDARKSFLTFEPLGVIGSIMPFNQVSWNGVEFLEIKFQINCKLAIPVLKIVVIQSPHHFRYSIYILRKMEVVTL